MASMDYENENGTRYEEEAPRYEPRDRSASPRPARRDSPRGGARRSASPSNGNGHADSRGPSVKNERGPPQDDGAINPGSNLFVTGIHPRLSEQEVTRLFEKYGDVEKCQIMLDPHTKESRGFGFVKMVTADQADAAKEGLQGETIEGRTLSIEKARRSRPRTPTPGKYFEEDGRGPPPGRYGDRYDDRRRGGGGGYGRDGGRDYDRGGYGGRRDDRDRGYGRDDYAPRGADRYSRDDRYSSGRDDRRGDDRRGGGYSSSGRDYERGGDRGSGREAPPPAAAYGDPAPRSENREPYGGRGDDERFSRREY
ncbi:related to TATA-binding protein associated factor 2N [Rhynchosporium secalis]|uniref:Related to TATA-binding protein associated factor 2N n=1 Tax=Rhynchosporium secalis TaxID=38038 RepID=A0A1E1MJT4_RHYSE|nr:related to TATA-binding protein associated factor 2N [Rhynchosporium secalis]